MSQDRSVYLVTYEKREPLISQIDLLNIYRRVCRSAALPVLYTEGFNPQPHLSFGPALPLGVSGLQEVMYLRLSEFMDPQEVMRLLAESLPPAVRVVSVELVEGKAVSLNSLVKAAEYACHIPVGAESILGDKFFAAVLPPVQDAREDSDPAAKASAGAVAAAGFQTLFNGPGSRGMKPADIEGAPKGLESLKISIENGRAVLRVVIRAEGGNISSPLGMLRAAAGDRFADFIWKVERVRLHFTKTHPAGPAED